jgi:hypothetical protein
MLNFVLIANPETRRVQLFQQALERCGLPPARSISPADYLADKRDLKVVATLKTSSLVRALIT